MSYNYHTRLKTNESRFHEINNLTGVTYTRSNGTVLPGTIAISIIQLRSYSVNPNFVDVDFDLQRFSINIDQLVDDSVTFLPLEGDILELPDGSIYQVISRSPNAPAWEYTTLSKERVLVYTQQLINTPS